jgi:hypothetical protein
LVAVSVFGAQPLHPNLHIGVLAATVLTVVVVVVVIVFSAAVVVSRVGERVKED